QHERIAHHRSHRRARRLPAQSAGRSAVDQGAQTEAADRKEAGEAGKRGGLTCTTVTASDLCRALGRERWLAIASFQQTIEPVEEITPKGVVKPDPVDQGSQPLRLGAVMGQPTVAPLTDQSGALEQGEMFRHGGLGYPS